MAGLEETGGPWYTRAVGEREGDMAGQKVAVTIEYCQL